MRLTEQQEKKILELFYKDEFESWNIRIEKIIENSPVTITLDDNSFDEDRVVYILNIDGTLHLVMDTRNFMEE